MRSNNIHFIFFISETRDDIPFTFIHWAAIKSAMVVNPDCAVHLWCRYLPDNNHYFDDLRDDLVIHQVVPPTEVFGRPLIHLAHRADWMRLNILYEHGGVYMDVDTICVQPFDRLPDVEFGIAEERGDGVVSGLCNCIMLAQPRSEFIRLWMAEYRTFRSKGHDRFWSEHSVSMPWKLSKKHPGLVTIFPTETFLHPDYTPDGVAQMFLRNQVFPKAIAHHLWELVSLPLHSKINESNYLEIDVSYTTIVRRILGKEVEALRAARLTRIFDCLARFAG
jgi:hypothetical protein